MKKNNVVFSVLALVLISGCVTDKRQDNTYDAQNSMKYQGEVIPPFFVKDFCDIPKIHNRSVAVIVSRLFVKAKETDFNIDENWVSFCTPEGGDYAYKLVGTTPSGITVLEATVNLGGSGTWIGVIFCKFENQKFIYDKEEQNLILRYLGEYFWGDRVYRDVKLQGNKLILGPTWTDIPAYKNHPEPGEIIILK